MRHVYSEQPKDVKFKRLTLHTGRQIDGWIVEENMMLGKPTVRFHVILDSSGKYCGSAHWIGKDEIAKIENLAHDPYSSGKRIVWV